MRRSYLGEPLVDLDEFSRWDSRMLDKGLL